jgi:hypothetical protein
MSGFALALRPEEAAALVEGWPDGLWLVAAADGAGRRWDACAREEVGVAAAALPIWPPLDGAPGEPPPADEEADLIGHLLSVPGLAAAAAARAARPSEAAEWVSAEDVDWDG